jgi:chemotaxis signal transduction protein
MKDSTQTDSAGERSAKKQKRAAEIRQADQVCIFTLAGERFALQTDILQEVVRDFAVEAIPLTPAAVVGIFNLRGTPTVLLDTEMLLRDSGGGSGNGSGIGSGNRGAAMVLRDDDLRVALMVDRVDGVVAFERAAMLAIPAKGARYCEGFLELPSQAGLVAVVSSEFLFQRIRALRFSKGNQPFAHEPLETV